MSIKRRIWALPVISAVIFGLGVAVSTSFATGALGSIRTTERVDYPALGISKALAAEIEGVTNGLRDAVSEGDKARIAQVGEQAAKVRTRVAEIREMGRATQGVTLIALDDGARLAGVQRVIESVNGDAAGDEAQAGAPEPETSTAD